MPTQSFRIAEFLVEPRLNRVTGADGTASLQPKIMDVLCLLADRQGEVLSRAELIDRIWGVEFGADESLTRAISQLRKTFADTRGEPRIIETIAKRGYRLIAPVLPPDPESAPPPPARKASRRGVLLLALGLIVLAVAAIAILRPREPDPVSRPAARTGIVVMVQPFTTDPGAPAANGLAEQLSTEIARSPLVRARTADSAPQPSDRMRYLLRGNVRRVGARVQVSAQLVDSATGNVVWGETYARPYDPSFSARDSIVAALSGELLLPLLRSAKAHLIAQPVLTLVPWELTLLVTWVPGDEGRPAGPLVEDSYWLQRRALELDPDYAPAHALFAQLASYHGLLHPSADSPRARARAQRHADRAIELAPYDAEVLYQVALHYRNVGDRDRARAMLERVVQLQPNHPLARIDLDFVRGHCGDGADAGIARLRALDAQMSASNPARWVALAHLSELYLAKGEFGLARDAARRARAIVPQTLTALTLAAANAELGRVDEAAATLAEHGREWPDLDLTRFAARIAPRWCLRGSGTPQVQATFRRLASAVRAPR